MNSSYAIYSHGERLSEVLKNFANNYNLQPVVSDRLSKEIKVSIESENGMEFLKALNGYYPFVWYYDGAAIYFYSTEEISNRMIPLQYTSPAKVLNIITLMGIWDDRFHWKEVKGQRMIYVSGPPRMLELIDQTVTMLDVDQSVDTYGFRVFPLKYANAADHSIQSRGKTVAARGVASTLKLLMGTTIAQEKEQDEKTVEGLRGQGLAATPTKQPKDAVEPSTALVGFAGSLRAIEADTRTNSVVIYDKRERFPMYEKIITQLDQPTEQVEIEVTIMNVSTEKLKSIGTSWRLNSEDGAVGYGELDSIEPGVGELAMALGEGVNFSSTISSAGEAILARISALEQTGDAKIVSRPTILTADNLQAVLDNSTTFYVRVAGQEEVDLFPVSVGAVLYVTPHIIREAEGNFVSLDLRIEDGQQTSDRVDGIPTVSNTTINTQALLGEHQSLMVGGYYADTDVETHSRVPVLHRIPLMGRLFKSKSTSTVSVSRVFMIKARVVSRIATQVNGAIDFKQLN